MSTTRRRGRLAAAAVLTLTAAGCSADPGRSTDPTAGSSAGGVASSSPTGTASPSPSDPTPSGPASGGAHGATPVTPDVDQLAWTPVAGVDPDAQVTVGGPWTLTVDPGGGRARLRGAGPRAVVVDAGRRERITDTFLTGEYAVVVAQDRLEQRPATATVIVLESGARLVLNGRGPAPTISGGTWALGGTETDTRLLHATYGADRAYCLAEVRLPAGTGRALWCAPPRHGFTDARVSPWGRSLLTFDDQQPSCRTVVLLEGDTPQPFPDVPDCHGWDGVALADGLVWSVVTNERRVEASRVFASVGGTVYDLGPGVTGSLVECAGAAYFARDPESDGAPARLLRWTADGRLSIVYESPVRRQAAVAAPRCGGDALTVSSLNDERDEVVWARVN